MSKKNKILLAAAGAAILLLLICLLVFRGGNGESQPAATAGTQNTPGVYTVELCNDSGMALEGVGIYVYTDATQQELVWFARTDAEGKITFRDVTCEGYIAVLDGVSSDYLYEETYPLTGEHTRIVVTAQMQSGMELSEITRKLGDVMFDFTVTSTDGVEYTLSELLKEKDAVVLNFWFLNCNPCRQEFPYLQEAYEAYGDKLEILALNPVDGTDEEIAVFKKELELTFPMFQCDPDWAHAMQLTAYPTTVIIDRYGVISLIHKGSVTETKVFTDAFSYFTDEEYTQGVVEDIGDLETEAPGSNPSEPIELGGVLTFQATIPAGGKVYYHLYRVNGYLSVSNANVYAIYNNNTYNPKNGGIGFHIKSPDTYTPAILTLGNSGKEDVTVTVNIAKPGGTFDNPYTAKLGEFTTTIGAGNDQGVYYQITAAKAGYLTIECLESTAGVKYDYSLYNLRSGRLNNIESDGNDEGTMVSVKVNAGDGVKIQLVTKPDSSGNYPAGTFKSKLFMSDTPVTEETEQAKKIDYAVTVTDENRNPVSGVYINVDTGDSKPTAIVTNEKGVAHTKLVVGDYPIVVLLREGYTAATTEFTLTEERPYASVKLDTVQQEIVMYTITVLDETGAPAAGVSVMIGSNQAVTDENGRVVFELPKGQYTVTISQPDGSVQNQPIPENSTELEMTLGQGSGGEEPADKVSYAVKVVDYFGTGQSGVTVQFLSGGNPVAVQTTDAGGQVLAELAPGDYTVSLAFSGSVMYYEQSSAVLSADKTSLTLRVTGQTSGAPADEWFGPTYTVGMGGTYVNVMQSNVVTYFSFTPDAEGLYRFSVSNPNAQISYWGSINYPIQQDPYGNATTTSFDLNIKENNLGGSYAIGVTGASKFILEIRRVGPSVMDDNDMPWDVYQGDRPTRNYSAEKSRYTYVDLTGATSDFTPVLGSDGYYHLNTANGPLLCVNLGPGARYISMFNMLGLSSYGGTRLGRYFYEEDGTLIRKEDYTECMIEYVLHRDPQNDAAVFQVYPLTEDLIYMLKNGGENQGWWDAANEHNFLFAELGDDFNPDLGWMFAVCY